MSPNDSLSLPRREGGSDHTAGSRPAVRVKPGGSPTPRRGRTRPRSSAVTSRLVADTACISIDRPFPPSWRSEISQFSGAGEGERRRKADCVAVRRADRAKRVRRKA
jgi:hypothetical protein